MNSEQTRTNEGGSVVSFIVIGVVLAAIVVGGIYIVQKRGENAPTVSSNPTASPSMSPIASDSTPPAVSPGTQATPTPSKTPSTQPSPSKTPLPSTGVPLPTTGPSDNLLSAIGFAILLGVSIAYLRSYKFRFGSLRR